MMMIIGGYLTHIVTPPLSPSTAEAAIVNLPRCEGGQGPGCEDMAAGSEFVRKLQERSAKNYDKALAKKVQNYNYNNFKVKKGDHVSLLLLQNL